MNKDRMLILADAIDNHTIADLGFNMNYIFIKLDEIRGMEDQTDYSGHNCTTIACIAGFASKVFENESDQITSVNYISDHRVFFAEKILELNEKEACSLFFNNDEYTDKFTQLDNHKAARMLRECVKQDRIIAWDEFFKMEGI